VRQRSWVIRDFRAQLRELHQVRADAHCTHLWQCVNTSRASATAQRVSSESPFCLPCSSLLPLEISLSTGGVSGLGRHRHTAHIAATSRFHARRRRDELLDNNSHFMANHEHLAILDKGVDEWNRWRFTYEGILPDLSEANLSRVNLAGANLENADLTEANLREANLAYANLESANLTKANLREANLAYAHLDKVELLHAKLLGADLNQAELVRANLIGANLVKADLTQASLQYTLLSAADLTEANLDQTDLMSADLTVATLSRANLRGANLAMANLGFANVSGAEFAGALAAQTRFASMDLSNAKGLDEMRHSGPSTIGIDTIYKSGGKIPEVFLRGAGVPDNFIAYIGSLVGRPIEFYSCFISYATKDQEFAERLHADLQAKGVRCWFAPENIAGGKKLHEQIDEAIRLHDRLLLILSSASMASRWVRTEIAKARKREEKSKRRVLFPVRLVSFEDLRDWECFDADIGIDSASEIREYFIPDFSNWKDHDEYQKALDRLLRDLKAETERAAAQS
jgi:uncharacterized protein YjbI with pentapeptide repeats